ncbi:uncharacterized protein LOC107264707 [Cephus cinctus]|uniref:Cilia- and flagella-associated protein 44 n=1 Tax=Cephus cinctus TaxID=211228 RepID=A0AAJ7BL18_CEPCN|nr:uncharacterized protein LOC107264707 [Cephus cinctus]
MPDDFNLYEKHVNIKYTMDDTDEDIENVENLPEDPESNIRVSETSAIATRSEIFTTETSTEFQDEIESHEDKQDIPPIHYDSQDYISGPQRTENGTVPMNILEFHHSYAYDCQKHFNLCVADPDTIIFASGNLINFFNFSENKLWFRRGSTGGGIGHITKNPTFNHIAVGENGINPPIIIYEWPNLEIVTILYEGTTRSYSHLAYSPDGLLMVSQGGDPDYLITVWDWQKSKIMLRCKSSGQDVFNVMFSPTVEGHLTSCGSGHIKFWKMAETFTGLKLKGELGRFGKTEISDISGVYPMPDEKVVSGCEWGNILLWDEGLIKLEVCKKNKKPCHDKQITQFEYNNGELTSVGMDGWIRIWFYETIDQADPPEGDQFLEIEPIYEFHITEEDEDDYDAEQSSMLMCIQKQNIEDAEENFWYAQDGNGGLWLIDLNTFETPERPRKIFTCHAGPITDMDVATWGPFVATIGRDAHLHIYNYFDKTLILVHKFCDIGSKVVWFPCGVEATGCTLVCAFSSGIIRMITVSILQANRTKKIKGDYVRLIQVVRPHKMPITSMSLNNTHSLLVTGSEDDTIFVFFVNTTATYPILVPIGFVKVPSPVTCMTWKPNHDMTILVGCLRGDCVEVTLPDVPQNYTKMSYELVRCELRIFKFQSVKSAIRRALIQAEIQKKKEEKLAKKKQALEQLRVDNPGIDIDEEAFLMDSEEEPVLPEIYIPKIPNRVLMVNYTPSGTIWLSMSGFDAGYIYEYPDPLPGNYINRKPTKSTMVYAADDTEINSCLFYKNRKYLFLGMEHGEIRICRVNPEDHTDFSDYWILSMHDNYNGYIPKILLSHDQKMLLTCGHDGNLFSFLINDDTPPLTFHIPRAKEPLLLPNVNVEDIEEPDYPSLEEVIVKAEYNRIMTVAKHKKDRTLDVLRELAEEFGRIMESNRYLVKSQQIPQEEFELDPRITEDLNEQLKAEMNLVHKKLAFKVEKSKLGLKKLMDHFIEPITCLPFAVRRILKPDTMVNSLRERKLGDEFTATLDEVTRRIEDREKAGRMVEVKSLQEEEEDEEKQKVQGIESFLKGLSPSTIQYRLGVKINHMLRKYRSRKARMEERYNEWKVMNASKPDPSVNHPDDVLAIEEAKETIGNYKLKISPDFNPPKGKRENTLTKYKQFLNSRKRAHHMREDFNSKLREVRSKKVALFNEVIELVMKLKEIHSEIPEERTKPLPIIPVIDQNIEFPEKNLELEKYTSMAERVKEAKRKKKSFIAEIVVSPNDEEYEVLLFDEKSIYIGDDDMQSTVASVVPETKYSVTNAISGDVLQTLNMSDHIETPCEREMKRARVMRKIYEQDSILRHIHESYEILDNQLDELERERLEIVAESVYMDLYMLTLHQELIILKEFEAMENTLEEKVNEKLKERATAKQKMQAMNIKIEQKIREIAKIQEKIKDVFSEYMSMINENRFYEFLRRIFKKKYKPPKTDDESSASSSSTTESSTDDDEAGSIDSREIGPIHVDENICPLGCDKELYAMAFSMRERRYEYELQVKEEQKSIELLRKEIENDTKKMKAIENNLKYNQDELEAFMREKQRKLNDIDITVILKFHQLQHFTGSSTVAQIQDCTVFDKEKLSHLYARVEELQKETSDQKAKHKKNRMHLHRMNVDCKHMELEIKKLKDNIKEEMMKKFGQEISLNALYEAVLRRMVYDIKVNINGMISSFEKEINSVKEAYAERVNILENLIQDNTEKLNLLTVLEEEKSKLRKILKHVPMTEEEIELSKLTYQNDISKLKSILKSQMHQKELFRNEIRNLSLKSRPLPPICSKKKSQKIRTEPHEDEQILAVIDIKTGDGYTIDKTQVKIKVDDVESNDYIEEEVELSDEEKEAEDDTKEREITDFSSSENTAMMIHRLLSRIIEMSLGDEQAEESTQEILNEVISNLPINGNHDDLEAGIERSVENIVAMLPQGNPERMEAMRQAVRESLSDIIIRLDSESKQIKSDDTDPDAKVKSKINELLENVGIETENMQIQNELVQLIKNGQGVDAVMEWLSDKLPVNMNEESKKTAQEYAMVTLAEITEQIIMSEEPVSVQAEEVEENIVSTENQSVKDDMSVD